MPIIELHDNYVRNYYTGKTISRDELLLQNNPLDKFLRRLNPHQLVRMRVDVYSIHLFYIVMSIYKARAGRLPGHWHFLAYPASHKGKKDNLMASDGPERKASASTDEEGAEEGGTEGEPGQNNEDQNNEYQNDDRQMAASEQQTYAAGELGLAIPSQTEFFSDVASNSNYPYNDLGFESADDFDQTDIPQDLPGSTDQGDSTEERSESVFSALAKMMQQSLNKRNPMGGGQRTIRSRFRSANPNAQDTSGAEIDMKQQQQQDLLGNPQPPLSFLQVLPALFDYMEEVQENTNRGYKLSSLADYNFRRDVLGRIGKTRAFTSEEFEMFKRIQKSAESIPSKRKDTLPVKSQETDLIVGKTLAVELNQRIANATLLHDSNQTNIEDLSGKVNIVGQFSLYPEIYRGLKFPLIEDILVLMPLKQTQPEQFQWRVITLVSPELDDFVTAYVYAKLEQGRLLIASNENGLRVASLPIVNQFPKTYFRQETWQIFLYSLLTMLILFGMVARYRKTR